MLIVLSLAGAGLLAPAAGAQAGGTPASSGMAGGAQYGRPIEIRERPVATLFRVAPRKLRAGQAPRIALRVDEGGVRTVTARLVFQPVRSGAIARVDIGDVRVGRETAVPWPSATQLQAGSYVVRLHVKDASGRTLRRTARASGRSSLQVVAPPAPPAPAPAPVAPITPTAPVVRAGGVFPVQGPHSYGDAFGAPRKGYEHQGVDVAAAEGVPIVAPLDGTITAVDYQARAAGYYIVQTALDGRAFFYAHCQEGSIVVVAGATVSAGQPLCRVGATGDASGPHLHFEMWEGGWRSSKDSHPVDPLPQLKAWDGAL